MAELNLLALLQRHCRADSLKLDIGANDGGYTNLMLDHPGDVHAFEPLPDLADVTSKRFMDNDRVDVWQCGVSSHEYVDSGFQVFEAWTLDKAHRAKRGLNAAAQAKYGDRTFTIAFITVDMHLRRHAAGRRVSFIKLDTDGYEYRVLRGAEETLAAHRPTILCEFNYMVDDLGDSVADFMALLEKHRYVVVTDQGEVHTPSWWTANWRYDTTFDVGLVPHEALADYDLTDTEETVHA